MKSFIKSILISLLISQSFYGKAMDFSEPRTMDILRYRWHQLDPQIQESIAKNYQIIEQRVTGYQTNMNADVHSLDTFVFKSERKIQSLLEVGRAFLLDQGDISISDIQKALIHDLTTYTDEKYSIHCQKAVQNQEVIVEVKKLEIIAYINQHFNNFNNELSQKFGGDVGLQNLVKELCSRVFSLTLKRAYEGEPSAFPLLYIAISENYANEGNCLEGRINRLFVRYCGLLGGIGLTDLILDNDTHFYRDNPALSLYVANQLWAKGDENSAQEAVTLFERLSLTVGVEYTAYQLGRACSLGKGIKKDLEAAWYYLSYDNSQDTRYQRHLILGSILADKSFSKYNLEAALNHLSIAQPHIPNVQPHIDRIKVELDAEQDAQRIAAEKKEVERLKQLEVDRIAAEKLKVQQAKETSAQAEKLWQENTVKSNSEAVKLFQGLYNQNQEIGPAAYRLGGAYYYGRGIKKDLEVAYNYFSDPSLDKDRSSLYFRGLILGDKNFSQPNLELALGNLQASLVLQMPNAQREIDRITLLWETEKLKAEQEALRIAAEKLKAQQAKETKVQAEQFWQQNTTDSNTEAVQLFQGLYNQNQEIGPAAYRLGAAYYYGRGIKKDLEAAYHYFSHSALDKDRSSLYFRGLILGDKSFSQPNLQLALGNLQTSLALQMPNAQREIDRITLLWETEKLKAEQEALRIAAEKLKAQQAKETSVQAEQLWQQNTLNSNTEAVRLFQDLYDQKQEIRASAYRLGAAYYYGRGTKKDLEVAYHYFSHSALDKDRSSLYFRGLILAESSFPQCNLKLALENLHASHAMEMPNAQREIDRITLLLKNSGSNT